MKRLVLAVSVALVSVVASGCAVGDPKPTTYISDTGATLNGDVYSSVAGDSEYWFVYGQTAAYGNETAHGTVAIADDDPHPVSVPITGLSAETEYHFQMCVKDEEEDPPRKVCSKDQTFTTGPVGGSSRIAYVSDGDIYLMDADGGDPTPLTTSGYNDGPSWSPDATRIVFRSNRDGDSEIYVMDADGANTTRLTHSPGYDADPAWSPDGSTIAFTSDREGTEEIYVMDPDGANQTNLSDDPVYATEAAWSPDGRRIAFNSYRDGNGEIYVMDAQGGNQTNLTNTPDSPDGHPAWSPDGTAIAFNGAGGDNAEILVMDSDGANPTALTDEPGDDQHPAWSPDGGTISFDAQVDGNQEIYAIDADGENRTNLTNDPRGDSSSAWSPRPFTPGPTDGRAGIAYISFDTIDNDIGAVDIIRADPDGSNQTNLTSTLDGLPQFPTWAPDGARIAFGFGPDGSSQDIWTMGADGSNPTNLTNSAASEGSPAWSPDGSRIAYTSYDGETAEVWVMDADGSNPTNLTAHEASDVSPAWSPDGLKIAFASDRGSGSGGDAIWVMDSNGTNPTRLTTSDTNQHAFLSSGAWSPDGQRITFDFLDGTNVRDVYVMDADGSNQVRLTFPATEWEYSLYAAWSPDGAKITFEGLRGSCCPLYTNLYSIEPDGSNETALVDSPDPTSAVQVAWSPLP